MKKKIILVLIFFILFIKSDYLYPLSEGGVIKKPVLTSKNFDNRATIIILKYKENDKEKTKEIGTGFFINDGKNFIYLVSAGHVFKKALQVLLVAKGTIVFFQKFEDANAEVKKILTYDIDLIEAWQGGLLKFNKDLSVDVGILKLRSFIDKNKKKEIQKPIFISSSIDLFSDQHIAKYDTLDKAEDILFFGYPVLPTLKQVDKTHSLDPLIRRGMISKKLDAKKFIIDGFVSKGSSGSPVFLRREFVMPLGGFRIELKFIGLITRYFPYYADKESEANDTQNAGLALVESVDNIADTLIEFDVQIAEKEKKAKE